MLSRAERANETDVPIDHNWVIPLRLLEIVTEMGSLKLVHAGQLFTCAAAMRLVPYRVTTRYPLAWPAAQLCGAAQGTTPAPR